MTAFLRFLKVLIKSHHYKINSYYILMITVILGLISFVFGIIAVAGVNKVNEARFRYDDRFLK